MNDDLERELGLAIPALGTLELEGIPVENGPPVVQLIATLPHGKSATFNLSLENARKTFEAGLEICAVLEEQF